MVKRKEEAVPYDPLSLPALGEGLVRELNSRPLHPLPPANRVPGCGIYALYYEGDFTPYRRLVERGARDDGEPIIPIYIGKAIPAGSRKGAVEFVVTEDAKIHERLRAHARTINAAENLRLEDFHCRFVVTAPVWIRLAESVAINEYHPVWNGPLEGFGNNDPGAGRRRQVRSAWDMLHPGRAWATLHPERDETAEELAEIAARYLLGRLPEEDPLGP